MGEQCDVIVFGKDKAGKWHAGRFKGEEAEKVMTAAESDGLRVVEPKNPESQKTTSQLQHGTIAEDGKLGVPGISKQLYVTLTKLADAEEASGGPTGKLPSEPAKPSDKGDPWDQIKLGSIVLGQSPDDEGNGWWEARVLTIEANGRLKLIYQDYPEEGNFWMDRRCVGVLAPGEKE